MSWIKSVWWVYRGARHKGITCYCHWLLLTNSELYELLPSLVWKRWERNKELKGKKPSPRTLERRAPIGDLSELKVRLPLTWVTRRRGPSPEEENQQYRRPDWSSKRRLRLLRTQPVMVKAFCWIKVLVSLAFTIEMDSSCLSFQRVLFMKLSFLSISVLARHVKFCYS